MFLNEEILNEFRKRASNYDKLNLFPKDDYKELKEKGYYKLFLPKEFGGEGYSLKEVAKEQTNIAKYAPATALGINMHQIIAGVGRYLYLNNHEAGLKILDIVKNNNLIAFGISESGNDKVLMGSTIEALKRDSGYIFNGMKVFVSLASHFDYILTFANEEKSASSIFALLERKESMEVKDDWDTLGMRGTQSNSILFNNLEVLEKEVLEKVKTDKNQSKLIFAIFAYFEILLAATYHGIGLRALELGIEAVKKRKSVLNNNTYSNDKDIRWRIAEAAITLDGISELIDVLADKVENNYNDPLIFQKLSSLKNKSVEATLKALNEVIRATGGRMYYNNNELSRLYRDSLAGLFQPSDQESLHNSWANALLGKIE